MISILCIATRGNCHIWNLFTNTHNTRFDNTRFFQTAFGRRSCFNLQRELVWNRYNFTCSDTIVIYNYVKASCIYRHDFTIANKYIVIVYACLRQQNSFILQRNYTAFNIWFVKFAFFRGHLLSVLYILYIYMYNTHRPARFWLLKKLSDIFGIAFHTDLGNDLQCNPFLSITVSLFYVFFFLYIKNKEVISGLSTKKWTGHCNIARMCLEM